MNKLFTEFENENELRSYPFSADCSLADTEGNALPMGLFIDAVLYPLNPKGTLYLSSIAESGVVSISDSHSVVMTATIEAGQSTLEFYDTSSLHRHTGTLIASSAEALNSILKAYKERKFRPTQTTFVSSCVFPIVNDGVLSLNVGNSGIQTGDITFINSNSESVRVSTGAGSSLRFDIVPIPEDLNLRSIQHIYCIVDGKTPFRIQKIPYDLDAPTIGNTIAIFLDNINRQDICGNAHREDGLELQDTCGCESSNSSDPDCPGAASRLQEPIEIPEAYQTEVVDIPNDSSSAFYLATPNILGYDNPLSLTLTDGAVLPKTNITITPEANTLEELADDVQAKGAILQVPGLSKL